MVSLIDVLAHHSVMLMQSRIGTDFLRLLWTDRIITCIFETCLTSAELLCKCHEMSQGPRWRCFSRPRAGEVKSRTDCPFWRDLMVFSTSTGMHLNTGLALCAGSWGRTCSVALWESQCFCSCYPQSSSEWHFVRGKGQSLPLQEQL